MEVLITSKTRRGKTACVGGLVLENNQYIRLLQPDGWDQPDDTPLNIGDIWDIEFENSDEIIRPHIEDVIVNDKEYLRSIDNIAKYLFECGVLIFRGEPERIFWGLLRWTHNGSGYIEGRNIDEDEEDLGYGDAEEDDYGVDYEDPDHLLPHQSVGFWVSDQDLTIDEDGKHYTYNIEGAFNSTRRFAYVGYEPPIEIIPSGTLVRISLARWWRPCLNPLITGHFFQNGLLPTLPLLAHL